MKMFEYIEYTHGPSEHYLNWDGTKVLVQAEEKILYLYTYFCQLDSKDSTSCINKLHSIF